MPTFGESGSILDNDDALKDGWTPDGLPEREEELAELHSILEPATRAKTPDNAFIYGPTGQGKTVATKMKLQELQSYLSDTESVNIDLTSFYVNCADLSSSYQVAGEILKEVSSDWDTRPRGHGLSEIFDMLFAALEDLGGIVYIVLDEIDVIGDDDTVLYKLSRAEANDELVGTRLTTIGVSNNFDFHANLSARVKDSLCEEEVRFAPYDAEQLRQILHRRAAVGFHADVLSDDVIPLCAAFAAQNTGSARQAIRLLYKAGKLAHNNKDELITESHVREAQDEIEREMLLEGLKDLTVQEYAALLAVASLEAKGETPAKTKDVYSEYRTIADAVDQDTSTLRSIRDHLQALDLYNFLEGRKEAVGSRGGPSWEFELRLNLSQITALTDNRFSDVIDAIEMAAEKNDIV